MTNVLRPAFDLNYNVVQQVEQKFIAMLKLTVEQVKHTAAVTAITTTTFASALSAATTISIGVIKELPMLEDSEVE